VSVEKKDVKSTLRGQIRNLVNESQTNSQKNQLFLSFVPNFPKKSWKNRVTATSSGLYEVVSVGLTRSAAERPTTKFGCDAGSMAPTAIECSRIRQKPGFPKVAPHSGECGYATIAGSRGAN
jgi:hypothetical protein